MPLMLCIARKHAIFLCEFPHWPLGGTRVPGAECFFLGQMHLQDSFGCPFFCCVRGQKQ